MSLDVYLFEKIKVDRTYKLRRAMFESDDGDEMEIYAYEWADGPICGKIPLPEFFVEYQVRTVYWSNITHNLNKMAAAAGIYEPLWRAEEHGFERAEQLIEPLSRGLRKLKENPDYCRQFDAKNGWGTYEHFTPWVGEYLRACKESPQACVRTSR